MRQAWTKLRSMRARVTSSSKGSSSRIEAARAALGALAGAGARGGRLVKVRSRIADLRVSLEREVELGARRDEAAM